jgi:DNA-binding response OmpR family regulator
MRIAILEDDPDQAALIEEVVANGGHDVHSYADGPALVRTCGQESFDLYILDWEVPGMSGEEVLRWIRAHAGAGVPVLFVTAHDEEGYVLRAFAAGADDYMIKPVRPPQLLARVSALLRRAYPMRNPAVVEYGGYSFDTRARKLRVAGVEVKLTQKEFDLALFLFRNIGRLLSRGHILDAVWGRPDESLTRTLDTHVSRLRRKLGLKAEHGIRLVAVYQFGYRLERIGAGD